MNTVMNWGENPHGLELKNIEIYNLIFLSKSFFYVIQPLVSEWRFRINDKNYGSSSRVRKGLRLLLEWKLTLYGTYNAPPNL